MSAGDLALVVNPVAGRGRAARTCDAIVAAVRARRTLTDDAVLTPASRAEAAAAMAGLVAEGTERIIVIGGDGMVHLAVGAVAGSPTVLGVVGVGTGNDFAAAVGLPRDPVAAIGAALAEPVAVDGVRVDAGEGAGSRAHWAATVVTTGFSADVNERAERLRVPRGSSRYTVATLLELPGMRPRPSRIVVDGVEHEHDATLVAVANTSSFGGGMMIAPDASPVDGLLDVVVVDAVSRLTLLRVLPAAFSGRHVEHPAVEVHRGRRVELGGSIGSVRADGEPLVHGPCAIEAIRGAIQVAGATVGAGR